MNRRWILDVLFGIYAAVLLVPAGALAGWEAGAARLPITVFVGIGVVLAALGTGVARTVDDLVDRLLSRSVVTVMVCLPLVFLPYLILVVDPASGAGTVAIAGLSAVVPGNGALLGGVIVRDRRLRETATEEVVVTVGDSETNNQRTLRIAAVMIVAMTLIANGAAIVLTGDISTTTFTTLVGGLIPVFLLFADTSRELAVTDVGFRSGQSTIVWDDLAGYRLTDDNVVLVRSEWYLPNRQFDRADISDEDALIKGLEGFLPRLDEQGRVELAARQ